MRISPDGLLALRIPVALALVASWNAGLLWASGELAPWVGLCPEPTLVTAIVMGATSLLMLSIVFAPAVQRLVLAPTRLRHYRPDPYFAIGVITAILAIAVSQHGI